MRHTATRGWDRNGERPMADDSHFSNRIVPREEGPVDAEARRSLHNPRARLKLGLTPEREHRLPFVLRRARHGEKIEDGRPDVLGSKAVLHGARPKLRTEPNQ